MSEFKAGDLPLRGSELTKAMLKRGDCLVNAWVSSKSDADARQQKVPTYIDSYSESFEMFGTHSNCCVEHAVPFDPRTDKEIIDLDGNVEVESE